MNGLGQEMRLPLAAAAGYLVGDALLVTLSVYGTEEQYS
jgi:hypothetical protein